MKSTFNKSVFIVIIQILTGAILYCQTEKNVIEVLTKKFEYYVKAVPWEEIYIHTDRDEYIAGENIWTSIYLFDRQSLNPSKRSKIAYVELMNSENRPVVQKRFLLINGTGPGQLELPDSLSTGTYTLRAYTNWMKNFLPINCFNKEINIYNPLSANSYLHKSSSAISWEGVNILAEESTNNGDSITLKTRAIAEGQLELNIYANDNYLLRNGNQFYLFIQTHGKIDLVLPGKIISNNSKISIPENSMDPGINQITVFNSRGQPVCETYNYTPEKESVSLSISSDDSYRVREKITLALKTEAEPSEAYNLTSLSISVAPRSETATMMDLAEYLIFGTEFGINKTASSNLSELPAVRIDSIIHNIRSFWINWDLILSGQIPHFKYQVEEKEHFISGNMSIDELSLDTSPEKVILCIPGRQPEFQYSNADKNGDFTFRLNIDEDIKSLIITPDNIGKEKKIMLESAYSDKYLFWSKQDHLTIKSFPEYIEEWSINFQTRKIYGIVEAGNPLPSKVSPLKPARFYGNPDIELILADYVNLPEMEEIFFELLPRISLKRKKSVYEILIADRINEHRYELSPHLFLDGVKIDDAEIIAGLDPQDVEKIDVVKEKYVIGDYFFEGILNVVTKSADFSSIPLPEYMIRLPYRVIDPVLSFVMPDYSSEASRNSSVPDFRNTLYWNPCLRPDDEGLIKLEFWTSDISGNYEINLQGINSEGAVISERKSFRIE